MSLRDVDSSSGALVSTDVDGTAISELIGNGDSTRATSIVGKFEFANISDPLLSSLDTLTTRDKLENGDNLVILKDDDSIHEVIASGVSILPKIPFVTVGSEVVLSNNNFTVTKPGVESHVNSQAYTGLISESFEITVEYVEGMNLWGVSTINTFQSSYFPSVSTGWGLQVSTAKSYHNAATTDTLLSFEVGETIHMKYDYDTGNLYFGKNKYSYVLLHTLGSNTPVYIAHALSHQGIYGTIVSKDQYAMDTSVITAGETPSRVYRVDESVLVNGTLATVKSNIYSIVDSIGPSEILNFNSEFTDNIDGWLKEGTGTIYWEAANGGALVTDPSPARGYQYVDVVPGVEHSVVWYADVSILQPQCHIFDTDDVTILYSRATNVSGEFSGTFIPTGNKIRVITGGPGTAGYNTRIRYCRTIGPTTIKQLISTREFNDISISGDQFQATIGMSATGNKMTELSYDGHIVPGSNIVDLQVGQVTHYLFNNNADDSFGNLDGVSTSVDFQGDVASFDGVTSFIDCGDAHDIGVNSKVFSLWVKGNTVGTATEYLLAKSRLGSDYSLYGLSVRAGGSLRFFLGNATTTANVTAETASGLLSSDNVYHIAVVITRTANIEIFVNAISRATASIAHYSTHDLNTSFDFEVGGYPDANGNAIASTSFDGDISNLRIYNEAKDQTFIDALYAEGYYPKPLPLPTTNGLVAHYPLTGTAEDTTGNYDGVENNIYVDDANFGSVADYNATDQDTIIANNNAFNTQEQTISFWCKIDSGDSNSFIGLLWKGETTSGDTRQSSFFVYNSNIYYAVSNEAKSNTAYAVTNVTNPRDGIFRHIVGVKKRGVTNDTIELYIDGTFSQSQDLVGHGLVVTDSIVLGRNYQSGTLIERMDGNLSNVRFYNEALTAIEITDIYNYEKNFRPIDIDDGLVAYYPLANNSLDNYYNEYDGVDTSMTYDGLSGVFNGTTSKISNLSFPHYSTLTACSLSMWVSCDMSIASNFVNIDNNSGLRIRSLNGNIQVLNNGGGSNFMANRIVATNEMVHIVVVNDATGLYLYFDAILDNSNDIPLQSSSTSTLGLFLGHYTDTSVSTEFLDGTLAKVRIYNKAITAEQVAVIYNTEKEYFV